MVQVKADMQGPQGSTSPARTPAARPLSPHLQVWRWHITMWGSILHRMSGVALYFGAFVAAAWAIALASGPEWYGRVMSWLAHPLGRLVLLGLTLAYFYHLGNGVRHLTWDAGKGVNPRLADMTGLAAMLFAVVATAAVWFVAYRLGVFA
jgi:succinate dehydrogenase / fumarate reductase, cytochrome b subunit